MIKRLTFSLLLTCLYVPCFSQERFVVRGRILDAESAPVPYCSVSILESRDSTILGGAVSDTEGRYSLHFEQAGRYLLCYDHLAYESCYRTVEVPEAQTLPDVILRPASRHIDEVVVVARNTEYRAGRYEVNMLGNPIVRNRSVMQVLDLLPGLRASDNTLSIKGTPVSVVYIDDRLVTDLGELSALRAEDVKSVEVQNKTGAAYSATTSGGIVRIRLKKLAAGSFYGNVSSSASVSRDGYSTGLALPFSAQCGRLGIYNYVSGSYGENETLDRTYSEFRNSGYSLDSEDRGRITSRNIRELLSLVYKINDRHSIGLGGQIFMGASDPSNTVHTTSAGLAWGDVPPQMPEAGYTLYRYGGGTLYNRQYQGSLNYIFRFDTLGSRLSFKADYLHQNVDRNYDYDTRDFSRPEDAEPFSTELRRERYKLLGHLFASRLDLNKNFSEERSLDVGLSYDLRYADNNAPVHRFEEEEWIPDPKMSTWFIDRTQSTGAYTQWADAYGKFSYQAGLRLQWDRIAYRNAENTGYEHRDYWRLFPELSLTYTFNPEKGTNINLDLYRSSGRLPDNNALSPRRVWQSQYSYTVGNENLEPGWGYDIDLSYTLRNKLTISYGGTWSRGSETMTFYDPDDPNIVYTTKVNGEHGSAHNIWIDYTTLVTKWFRVKSFIHGYWYRREVDGDWQASYSAGGGMFSLSLMFQPHPSMIIYLDGGVELPQKRLETWQNSYWALAAGITKSFCKDKLYISLDVNNILSTKLKKETVRWDNSYYSVLRQPRGHRSLRLVFSIGYRFNRNAKKSVSTVQTLRDPEEILK
ncbi:MAG: outer membrane beta-barrel protein [Alistipes sp.]